MMNKVDTDSIKLYEEFKRVHHGIQHQEDLITKLTLELKLAEKSLNNYKAELQTLRCLSNEGYNK